MKRVRKVNEQESQEREIRPIRMEYMYQIKYLVPKDEAVGMPTARAPGGWAAVVDN